MAKFGVDKIVGAALGAAIVLAPTEANGMGVSEGPGIRSIHTDRMEAAREIAKECRGVGNTVRTSLTEDFYSGDSQIGALVDLMPEYIDKKGNEAADVCMEDDINAYCTGVGQQIRSNLLDQYESSHQSIEATADEEGDQATNRCKDEMYARTIRQ